MVLHRSCTPFEDCGISIFQFGPFIYHSRLSCLSNFESLMYEDFFSVELCMSKVSIERFILLECYRHTLSAEGYELASTMALLFSDTQEDCTSLHLGEKIFTRHKLTLHLTCLRNKRDWNFKKTTETTNYLPWHRWGRLPIRLATTSVFYRCWKKGESIEASNHPIVLNDAES